MKNNSTLLTRKLARELLNESVRGHVVIPDNFTVIDEYAFSGYTCLIEVTFPSTLTAIGPSAFESCVNLDAVNFENCRNLTSIGDSAFMDCRSLKCIEFPYGITRIEDYTCSGCTWLTDVFIPDTVTDIGDYAFFECI